MGISAAAELVADAGRRAAWLKDALWEALVCQVKDLVLGLAGGH